MMNLEIPQRLARRAGGREWSIPDVVAAFAAARATTAVRAHVYIATHLVLELMAIPGTYKFLARRGRLSLIGLSGVEWVITTLPDLTGGGGGGREDSLVRGPLRDIAIGQRGLLMGRVMIAREMFFVPKRQHRDLEELLLRFRQV